MENLFRTFEVGLRVLLLVGILVLGISFLIPESTPVLILENQPDFNMQQDFSEKKYSTLVRILEENKEFVCSGTVISNDYVLTAAHCVVDKNGLQKKMYIQSLDRTFTIEVIPTAANPRADYALIKGNFKEFTKMPVSILAENDPAIRGPRPQIIEFFGQNLKVPGTFLTCGFAWGAGDVCYSTLFGEIPTKSFNQLQLIGNMYPGMSGGPVIDKNSGMVVAVNSAIGPNSVIFVSPLIGLFETLKVKVH